MWLLMIVLPAASGLLIILYRFLRTEEINRENENIRVYMDSMRTYYGILSEQIDLAKRYRHDLAGHIRTLDEMMKHSEEGKILKDYQDILIAQQKVMQTEAEQMRSWNSPELINAIISLFSKRCINAGIEFETRIERFDYSENKLMNLSALMHNLLENALEECQKINAVRLRKVELEIKSDVAEKEIRIYITVTNTIREGKKHLFRSEKEDQIVHGIGNEVITKIVEQYHGDIQDSVFKKDMALWLKRDILLWLR